MQTFVQDCPNEACLIRAKGYKEMAFVKIPGLNGKVYVPDETEGEIRKHQCRECFSCQWCSDDRCCVCMGRKRCTNKKNCHEHET
ncbi:MAG: hypothetical protein C4522_12020 [Desulfobacteraceae bacterium]|nr:MAG: hypothetical protein C4522_12020 [Desulfobacteraceae bacterium]